MRRGRRPARGCPGWRSAPSSELMRRRRRPTTGPDDGFARGACLRAVRSVAAARRLEASILHSKLTPWVVLDETYLGAYGRVRDQYQISEPTAGASAPRRLTPWPNNPQPPRLTPSTPCAPWPTCPCTRSSTRGRRRRRDGHVDKLLRYHHIPHSVSRGFS